MPRRLPFFLVLGLLATAAGAAQDNSPQVQAPPISKLQQQNDRIKAGMLDLEAELTSIQQDIRYPKNTRLTVYVTAEPKAAASLTDVALIADGHTLASQRYTADERKALQNGGAARLYIGSLDAGQHRFQVRAGDAQTVMFNFDKTRGPRILELHWRGADGKLGHRNYADQP